MKRTLALLISASMCIGMFLPVSAAGAGADGTVAAADVLTEAESVETADDIIGELTTEAGNPQPIFEGGDAEENVLGVTTEDFESAFKDINKALENWNRADGEIKVDLSGYMIPAPKSKEEVNPTFDAFIQGVINRNPQYFYIDNNFKYSFKIEGETSYLEILTISIKDDYAPEKVDEFNKKVQDILSGVDETWTDVQKVLYIHDYLVTHAKYEESTDGEHTKFNAYNAIVEGECVCQGYSLAFEYLVNQIDKDFGCDVITSNGINHAWNVITIDGEKYYVDCTWDDPVNMCMYNCSHKNFLRSRAEFEKLGGPEGKHGDHHDWVDSYGRAAYDFETDDKYDNYFWKDASYLIPMKGTRGYYYTSIWNVPNNEIKVRYYDFSDGSDGETGFEYMDAWKVWGQDNNYYTEPYAFIGIVGDRLLATGPSRLYYYDLDEGTKESVGITTTTTGYVYSALFEEETMYYQQGTSPNLDDLDPELYEVDLKMIDGMQDQDGFALTPSKKTLTWGDPDFVLTVANAKTPVKFSSSNEKVAEVDKSGKVHIKSTGKTTLQAVAEEKGQYRKAKASCDLTVNKKAFSIKDITKDLYYDEKNSLSFNFAEYMPEDAGELTSNIEILCDPDFDGKLSYGINNGILVYKTSALKDEDLSGELKDTVINVKISSLNYEDVAFKIVMKYSKTPTTDPDSDPQNPDPDPAPAPVIDPYWRDTFISNTKDDAGKPVTINLAWSKSVSYNGKKHINIGGVAKKNVDTDVTVSVNDTFSECAVPVIKFKNNKNMSEGAEPTKKPWFTITYKTKPGVSKEKKKFIKALNKELKTKFFKFEISKADIGEYIVIDIKFDRTKNKVSKLVISNGKNTFKLKKNDFNHEFTDDDKVVIKGIGKYSGQITHKLPGVI